MKKFLLAAMVAAALAVASASAFAANGSIWPDKENGSVWPKKADFKQAPTNGIDCVCKKPWDPTEV